MRKLSSDKEVHKKVYLESKKVFDRSKKEMLEDFNRHPVTKELRAGPNAYNHSGTLIGTGNLYSFIGFQQGENPAQKVYDYLNFNTQLIGRTPRVVRKTQRSVFLGFRTKTPSKRELASISPMPWEPGSWLFKIESGMSGLGQYIYEKYIKASRSGSGIQADGKVRQAVFKRVSYMSAILNTFKRNFVK